MKGLDIVVIIFVGLATVRGLFRGAIRELFSFGGIIFGIILGGKYYTGVEQIFSFVRSPVLRSVLAFAIIFLVVYLLFTLFGIILKRLFKLLFLSFLDHLAGAVLGFFEGALFIGLVLYLIVSLLPDGQTIFQGNPWAYKVFEISNHILGVFLKGISP